VRWKRSLVFALLTSGALATASAFAQPQPGERIEELIAKVRSEPNAGARMEYAAQLGEYIAAQRNGIELVDDKVIGDIASLLSHSDDWVRFYAAASLGFFGPRARSVVPALERALEQAKQTSLGAGQSAVFAGISSEEAICAALTKIDLARVPADCRRYR
jgi:hypothetical protein